MPVVPACYIPLHKVTLPFFEHFQWFKGIKTTGNRENRICLLQLSVQNAIKFLITRESVAHIFATIKNLPDMTITRLLPRALKFIQFCPDMHILVVHSVLKSQ